MIQEHITKSTTWAIRLYREEDKESLLRLSTLHYGEKELASSDFVDWLHKGNPAGESVVVVAEEFQTKEIIGFVWHVPFLCSLNGEIVRCYLGCNGLVHPDYRRHGVYSEVHARVFEELKDGAFIYGFPKPVAVRPLQKMGFAQVGSIALLLRPLDIRRLSHARFSNIGLRLAVNVGWTIAGNTIFYPSTTTNGSGHAMIEVRREFAFDESFDDFWDRVSSKYEICTVRDQTFLNWRFCSSSFRTYHILTARLNSEVLGYAVLRCTSIDGIQIGLIMDMMVEESARGNEAGLLLVENATRFFEEAGMSLGGSLLMSHTQEYRILRVIVTQ